MTLGIAMMLLLTVTVRIDDNDKGGGVGACYEDVWEINKKIHVKQRCFCYVFFHALMCVCICFCKALSIIIVTQVRTAQVACRWSNVLSDLPSKSCRALPQQPPSILF